MKEDSEECESETICLKSEMNVLCLNVVIISIIPKRKKEEGQFLMKKNSNLQLIKILVLRISLVHKNRIRRGEKIKMK